MLNSILPFHILGRRFIFVSNSICVFQPDLINYFRFCCCCYCCCVCLVQVLVANKSFSASSLNVRVHIANTTQSCFYVYLLFFHWHTIHKECNTKQVMYETKEMKLIRMPSYRQSRRGHTKCDTRISKNIHHKRFMRVLCALFFFFLHYCSDKRTREVE